MKHVLALANSKKSLGKSVPSNLSFLVGIAIKFFLCLSIFSTNFYCKSVLNPKEPKCSYRLISVSKDLNQFAGVCKKNKTVDILDYKSGALIKSFTYNEDFFPMLLNSLPMESLNFSPDGKELILKGFNQTLVIYNIQAGTETTLKDYSKIVVSGNGKFIALLKSGTSFEILDASGLKKIKEFTIQYEDFTNVQKYAISDDGNFIVGEFYTYNEDYSKQWVTVFSYSIPEGKISVLDKLISEGGGIQDTIDKIVFVPEKHLFAVLVYIGKIYLWDAENASLKTEYDFERRKNASDVKISSDGKYLVYLVTEKRMSSKYSTICVKLNLVTKELTETDSIGENFSIVLSPDGKKIIYSYEGKIIDRLSLE